MENKGTAMREVVDKIVLLLLGLVMCAGGGDFTDPVVLMLVALIYAGLTLFFSGKRVKTVLLLLFCALALWLPHLLFFLPLAVYDTARDRIWAGLCGEAFMAIVFFSEERMALWQISLLAVGILLAVLLETRTKEQNKMQHDLIVLRDDSTELWNAMQSKQKELLEKQDQEVHLATLQERNRIAREIHDHVGHMLTRSILQMGALLTIYPEEPLHAQLLGVNDTLNEAMNNIRESVHDLHDESVDLKQNISDVLTELGQRFQVRYDYDMGEGVPRDVKYCLIAVVKEASSNMLWHSSGDRASVLLREHPAFYQMIIEDNGMKKDRQTEPGIGLSTMTERVEALKGQIHFSAESGFKISISIPKKHRKETVE